MPKVTIEFNLPEEKDEHTLAIKGGEFWSALWELDQDLRGWLKHGHQFKTVDDALDTIREKIHESVDLNCVE